ncbi:MAG: TrkH family potassium uptake protein [Gemmatimonadota bacterium]
MNLAAAVHVVGIILLGVAAAEALSGGVGLLYEGGGAGALFLSSLVTAAAGVAAWRLTKAPEELRVREGYAIVGFGWLAAGLFGALPYLLSNATGSLTDAIFESISGFTTTGASVFTDIAGQPRGLLFWRSFTQWLGGMGIIVLGVAILPYLGVGGMQLFRAEVPGPTPERLRPRISQTAKLLWIVYAGFSAAQIALYLVGGLDPFDAVTHTFGTMATGGFSPRNASIGAYGSPFVEYVTVLFMYVAGINFALHYRALTGRPRAFWGDEEWRFYTALALIATAAIAGERILRSGSAVEPAVREALFQVVSIGTTTGFATADYTLWSPATQIILVLLMFAGGMVGSTGGGMKTFRLWLILKQGVLELRKHLHPRAVIVPKVAGKPIPEGIAVNIAGFILLYITLFAAGTLWLTLFDIDMVTAAGASAATIGNVGPGLGLVGPAANYAWMPDAAKWACTFLMLAGRLEIYTVLVLLHPEFWRK